MDINKLSSAIARMNLYLLQRKIYIYLIVLFFLSLKDLGQFFHPQFWAEDGTIFFAQAVMFHWHSMVMPYGGYLHFVPRIVANFAMYFPYRYSEVIFGYAAILVVFFTVSRCLNDRLDLPYKAFFALSIILIPNGGEIFLVLVNVQWLLAPVLFLYVFYRAPKNFQELSGDVLIILILGLTGPFAFLCYPFYVWRFLQNRRTLSWLITITCACAIQIIFSDFIFHQIAGHATEFSSVWLQSLGIRFFANIFYSHWLPIHYHGAFLSFIALLFPFFVAIFLVPSAYKKEAFCFCWFWYLNVFVMIFRVQPALSYDNGGGDRYVYIPALLIAWLLIVSLKNRGWRFIVAVVFLLLMFLQSMLHFSGKHGGNNHWSYYSEQIKSGVPLVISIRPAGWSIRLYQ